MTLNAVERCPICGQISKKREFKEGKCYHCNKIESLEKENKTLIKRVSMLEIYYGVNKEDYFGVGAWHKITEEESDRIKKQARIFCGDGKI